MLDVPQARPQRLRLEQFRQPALARIDALLPEVRSWLAEHRRLELLLHEIHQLTVALLRARARLLKLKAGRP